MQTMQFKWEYLIPVFLNCRFHKLIEPWQNLEYVDKNRNQWTNEDPDFTIPEWAYFHT